MKHSGGWVLAFATVALALVAPRESRAHERSALRTEFGVASPAGVLGVRASFTIAGNDTRLEPGWHVAARAFIQAPENSRRAGYFRFQLDDERWRARLLAWIVAQRGRFLGLPYGDQGLLIARDRYREIGGFKPMALMEDVDIVRRIGARDLAPLPATAVNSAERYRREGFIRRPLRNLLCLSLHFLGAPPAMIARIYG